MDVICEACGETNRSGQEFCSSCHAFLAWNASDVGDAPPEPSPRPDIQPAERRGSTPVPRPVHEVEADTTLANLPPVPQAPPRPRQAARPEAPPPDPAAASVPTDGPCPRCQEPNGRERRYCRRCGQVLAAAPSPVTAEPGRSQQARDLRQGARSARAAYRRSLPTAYRVRRVVIPVTVLAVIAAGAGFAGRDPIERATNFYYDWKEVTTVVAVTNVSAEPADVSVDDTLPENLIDGTETAWTTPWRTKDKTSCRGSQRGGAVTFHFQPRRIRRVDFWGGLPAAEADRKRQFRPKVLGISFDGDTDCTRLSVKSNGKPESLAVDSRGEVRSMRLVVLSVYAPEEKDRQRRLSILDVRLVGRP